MNSLIEYLMDMEKEIPEGYYALYSEGTIVRGDDLMYVHRKRPVPVEKAVPECVGSVMLMDFSLNPPPNGYATGVYQILRKRNTDPKYLKAVSGLRGILDRIES